MRFTELTLMFGLLAFEYSGHGQDAVKSEKSIAPIPAQTPAKAAQPNTTVEKNAEVYFSGV